MPGAKSAIWKHFRKVDSKKAQCTKCFKHYAITDNTTNFWTHLQKHGISKPSKPTATADEGEDADDPASVVEVIEEGINPFHSLTHTTIGDVGSTTSPSTSASPAGSRGVTPSQQVKRKREEVSHRQEGSFGVAKSYEDGGTRSALLKDALLYMVTQDHMPLSTPEKKGFRFFAKKCVPLWTPPSRQALTNYMDDKYTSLSEIVKTAIERLPAVCLTADCWTETHTTKSYLGITLHFFKGTQMQSAVLGVFPMLESHTTQYIVDQIRAVGIEWKIQINKVGLIVIDNAASMTSAAKAVFGDDRHIPCFAHTLNLVPKAAISTKKVKDGEVENVPGLLPLIKKIKTIVTFSHNSYNCANEMRKVQMEAGKTEGTCLRLVQDVPTRWSSTYEMLNRFLDLKEVMSRVLLPFPDCTMLSGAELATVQIVVNILQPFARITTEMSSEKSTTASKVIPYVYMLRQKIQDMVIPEADATAHRLRSFVLSELKRRFFVLESVLPLAVATFMDPRCKNLHFTQPVAKANTLTHIKNELQVLQRRSAEEHRRPVATVTHRDSDDLWSVHDALVASQQGNSSTDDCPGGFPVALHQYLNRPVLDRGVNPLEAWETLKTEYPDLYIIARRYLPLMATSVPAERLFSEAGLIATDNRSRLTSDHLSRLIFLNSVSEELWCEVSRNLY